MTSPRPVDLLVAGGTVITMDADRRILPDGAVAVVGDRIVAVGETRALEEAHRTVRRIDAARKVVMPGLIDGHAHAGHGLVRSLGLGSGARWFEACERAYRTGSSAEFWHAEGQLTAVERLKAGTTCGVSYLGGGDSVMRTDHPRYGDAHAAAVDAVGIRGVMAVGPSRPPFPRHFVTWEADEPGERAVSFEEQLDTCQALAERWHGRGYGLIQVALCFPVTGPQEARDDPTRFAEIGRQARAVRALGRRHGLRFTQDGHRDGSLQLAHEELGLLGPDAYFAHCVDLTPEEIELCAHTDTRVIHNPSAHMSITGRCPVPELLDAGVTVGLGSDGTAPDRSADMFRHMFQCMHYHRRHFRDPMVLPPGKALEMATVDAARALGLETEIGSLEPGKKADLVLVDMFKPHLYPPNMPLYRITSYATGADVDTVIVDGRVLMDGRVVRSVDERAVLEAAATETERMLQRAGIAHMVEPHGRIWRSSHY